MFHNLTRCRLVGLLVVLILCAVVLLGRWANATTVGGQPPAEPFRIAGNFYYVGANDISAFLITGPEGHVVLDGGYPSTARLIMGSVAKLGFDIKDVKVLVNSEPHADHAGGLTVLQQYPEQAADRERSLRVLRSLPVDIWVTNHARAWGRYRKFIASATAKNPVDPFIDAEGYRAHIDNAEAELREGKVH